MKWLILLLVLFSSDSVGNLIISETSDYVEINHVYRNDLTEKDYKKRMIQVIWWEWKNSVLLPVKDSLGNETGNWRRSGCFIVRDYRVIWSESSSPQQKLSITPRREGKNYICLFYDKDNRVIRMVRSGWLITTHTINDREIDNRRVIRLENRNKLINPQKN